MSYPIKSPCPYMHEDPGVVEEGVIRGRRALWYGVAPADLPAYLVAKGFSEGEALLIGAAALLAKKYAEEP